MPDPLVTGDLSSQTAQQVGTQESGGGPFKPANANVDLPLTQAARPDAQVPVNAPAADQLQPDRAPQSGNDAQAQPVGQGDPVAADQQHPDDQGKGPNDKEQPRPQPAQKATPPLPDSLRQVPRTLRTNRDSTHGQDPGLNKFRA